MEISKSLEPVAALMLQEDGPHTVDQCLALSLAISAKRIATSLETLAGELAHPEWGLTPSIRRAAGI